MHNQQKLSCCRFVLDPDQVFVLTFSNRNLLRGAALGMEVISATLTGLPKKQLLYHTSLPN